MRFFVRMLGYLLVAAGFVVFLTDGARSIANSAWQFTPFGEGLAMILRDRFLQLGPAVERNLHPLLWDPVLLTLMRAPLFAVVLLLGFLLFRLGARPSRQIGFVTRR